MTDRSTTHLHTDLQGRALPSTPVLRTVRDDDRDGLVALIAAVYGEYPGCVLDLAGVDSDLHAPAASAASSGGRWWVVDEDGTLVASIGVGATSDTGQAELTRLYVAKTHRGRGLATRLVAHVEQSARTSGARVIELWSDTRFADAHRLYHRLGYGRTGETRHLDDPSDTTEWRFRKAL